MKKAITVHLHKSRLLLRSASVAMALFAGFPSCRLVLMGMAFFGFLNVYCLRVNLSVAIVAMVNSTYIRELDAAGDHDGDHQQMTNQTEEEEAPCPQSTNKTIKDVSLLTFPPLPFFLDLLQISLLSVCACVCVCVHFALCVCVFIPISRINHYSLRLSSKYRPNSFRFSIK